MPIPRSGLDEIYVDVDEYFKSHDVELKKRNALALVSEFEARLDRQGRFLDVGCGAGEILWAAKSRGWEIEGVDPSADFIEAGRRRFGVEGRVSTLEDAAFPADHFDAVAMSGVIEHLFDPRTTLTEIWRVLKPDGVLWLDAPNEDGLYMVVGNLYMKLRGKDWVVVLAPTFSPFHVQGFNPSSFSRLLESVGFEVGTISNFGDVNRQQGDPTIRRRIEFALAVAVNSLGKWIGRGLYMSAWTRKKSK